MTISLIQDTSSRLKSTRAAPFRFGRICVTVLLKYNLKSNQEVWISSATIFAFFFKLWELGACSHVVREVIFRRRDDFCVWIKILYDKWNDISGWGARIKVHNSFSISTDQKLCEVPRHLSGQILLLIKQTTVPTQVFINFTSFVSICADFAKHWKLSFHAFLRVFFDFCICAGLLFVELVARECEYFEPLITILFPQLR